MKTTTKWLQEHNYCTPSHNWWKRNKSRFKTDLEVVNALVDEGHLEWANWLIVRLLDDDKRVEYAIFAAEQVLPIYEAYAPRKAIEAAKTGERVDIAAHAAAAVEAAWASAWAAYAAANTGETAAYAAANTAAYAATVIRISGPNMLKAIVNQGITLLTEVNK